MKLLEANRVVLEARFPDVYRELIRLGDGESGYQLGGGGDAWELSCRHGDSFVHPYGKGDSDKLVKRWVEGVETQAGGVYAMSGIGTGRHVRALLNKANQESYFFLLEQNVAWLRELFSKVNCEDLLQDKRFILAVGEVNDDLFRGLGDVNLNLVNDAKPLLFTPLHYLAEDYYNEYLGALARYLGMARKLQQTNVTDSGMWQEATLKNMKYLLMAPDIGETRGMFEGLPIVVVSAGPSLDKSLEFLKQVKGKAIIVCVNSAYRAMVHAGVKPHFTIAADPRMSTYRGYEGQDVDGVHLVCSHFVNTEVAELFQGRAFTWSTGNKLVDLLRKRLGMGPATPVLELGTIAASVFSLAKLWGCSKMCFVGQDLAICEDGRGHASDTFYKDYDELFEDVQGCRKLPGNVAEEVLVEEKLFTYWKIFNQLVKETDDIEFINTSELGVKIEGVPYVEFSGALEWLGDNSVETVEKTLKDFEGVGVAKEVIPMKIRQGVDTLHQLADRVFTVSLEAALYTELLPKKLSGNSYAEHSGIKRALNYAKELKKITDIYPEETQVLFDGQAKQELHKYMEFCRDYEAGAKHWEAVVKNGEYYWALAEGAYFLLSRIEAEI